MVLSLVSAGGGARRVGGATDAAQTGERRSRLKALSPGIVHTLKNVFSLSFCAQEYRKKHKDACRKLKYSQKT